jgi:4-hydroxybenzoate polyprenyltransferase
VIALLHTWRQYLAERFPVPVTLLLAVATAAAATAVARPGVLVVDATALGGAALMFLLLFHLRVFDEHKDFEEDAAARPDRPVQRGLVTLRQLKIAGAAAIGLELALGGWWWLLPLGYSVLMLFEFFAPRWLARHYPIYAISHSAVTSVVALALVMRAGGALRLDTIVLAGLALASTFAIDVLRKTWAPVHELDGVASWSKQLGVARAGWLGIGLLGFAGAAAAHLGWYAGGGWPWIAVVALVTGWGARTIRRFVAAPTPAAEKSLQVVAGVHYLVVWTGIAVCAAAAHGLELRL